MQSFLRLRMKEYNTTLNFRRIWVSILNVFRNTSFWGPPYIYIKSYCNIVYARRRVKHRLKREGRVALRGESSAEYIILNLKEKANRAIIGIIRIAIIIKPLAITIEVYN
jgi:hypothetical protein